MPLATFESPALTIDLKNPERIKNLALKLDVNQRRKFADYVKELVAIDKQSMDEWLGKARGYLDKIDSDENDSQPQNTEAQGSNEQGPPSTGLTLSAVIQFAARATGAILSEPDLAMASKPGAEPLAAWVSDQLRATDPDWIIDTDPLCIHMAVTGLSWRKRWYDEYHGQFRSSFLKCDEVIVNANVKSLERCPRTTHAFQKYPYEIQRSIELKHWINYEPRFDEIDPQALQDFYETDLWFDMDGDGYDEPWTVTVALDDMAEVVKIVPRWSKKTVIDTAEELVFRPYRRYYAYKMIPDPKGTFFPKGFGWLLDKIESSANSLLASIDDTAKSAAQNGGITSTGGVGLPDKIEVSGDRLTAINTDGRPLEQVLSLFPQKQVSPGMFQTLDKVLTLGDRLAGTLNLLENAPASMTATLAHGLIDNGSQVQGAVHRRLVGAMTEEFRAFTLMADAMDKLPTDANGALPIQVTADPTMATEMHRSAVAQVYQEMLQNPVVWNVKEAAIRYAKVMRLPDPEKLIANLPAPQTSEKDKAEIAIKMDKNKIENMKANASIALQLAQAFKAYAEARMAGAGGADMQEMAQKIANLEYVMQRMVSDGTDSDGSGSAGLAAPPDNAGLLPPPSQPDGSDIGGSLFPGSAGAGPAAAGAGGGLSQPPSAV